MINSNPNGKLYIVATPIGNLGDMTPRAIEILREVDIIAAEDTKTSMTLLTKFEIKTKLVSNHKFNETASAEYFLRELQNGKNIAVISDAGTPCISDPGSVLVKKVVESGENIEIIAIPGACAAAAAISVSGFEIKSFVFSGFFPRDNSGAKKIMDKLCRGEQCSPANSNVYIFYESPRRIIKTLENFAKNLPDCDICLCNDLTKKFERIYRGSPAKILQELRENPSAEKGEYTIVVETQTPVGSADTPFQKGAQSIESIITDVMIKQKCGIKDAVKFIAENDAYDCGKNEVYAASLNLKKMFKN